MKTNILQFIGSFHQGGSERQVVQLTRLLLEDETFNVFLATLNKEGVLLDELEKKGFTDIPEFKLTSFFNLNFLRQVRKCAKFLREKKIGIVHTHDFYTNIFGILSAKYAGIPVKIASKRETGGMRSATQNRIEKFVFKTADIITVNAEAVKKYLVVRGISPTKIEITYNGLDLEYLKPKETNRGIICEKLNLPRDQNARFITLVANLRHEVKNQEMLLDVAKKIRDDFPNAHFVFAGEGDRKRILEKMAEELGVSENTHFIGRCDLVSELLSISYACVLTSTAEGFSNSILEYMAAVKPVIATNVGGAREVIVEGETGYLIESGDSDAMASRLLNLLKNPENSAKMGTKGRRVIEEKFSTETQLERIVSLYKSQLK